jgi:hypothetical protein
MPWHPCLHCGEETSNRCKYCERSYCDIDCRRKDEVEHIKVHMNIQRTMPQNIERAQKAGKLAQVLFYTFMENTWNYDMRRVCIKRNQDGDLVAVEVTDGAGVLGSLTGQTDCKRYAGGWFTRFPVNNFGTFDEDAKHALLTDHSSIWAFVVMHAVIQALFQGMQRDLSYT